MTRILLCAIILFSFLACHQDSEEIVKVIEYPTPPAVRISTSLVTQVSDAPPDDGVQQVTFTDQSSTPGEYTLNWFSASGVDRSYEQVDIRTETGHLFHKIYPLVENDINYGHITVPGLENFEGQTADRYDFTIQNIARLTIAAHGLVTADGAVYEGNYHLAVAFMDPNSSASNAIPSFAGIDAQFQYSGLLFSHAFWITATTPNGESLHFNSNCAIATPGPSGTHWYFDPTKATWLEQLSTTTPDPDRIILDQSGYYGYADARPLVYVKGTFQINGISTPHYPIHIEYEGQQQTVFSTNLGYWAAQLPAATACKIKVDLPCGTTFEKTMITSDEDQQTYSIIVNNSDIKTVRVDGTAVDCQSNPLNTHFTIIEGANTSILFAKNDEIHFDVPVCGTSPLIISSYDPISLQSGPEVAWDPVDTIHLYTSMACDMAKQEYLSLMVSGEKKVYWNLASMMDGGKLVISENGLDPEVEILIFIEGLAKGNYEDTMLNILFEDKHLGNKGYALNCPTATSGCGFTDFTITQFADAQGQWIRGHFEGKFWIKTFHPLTAGYRPIAGDFQVYRDF